MKQLAYMRLAFFTTVQPAKKAAKNFIISLTTACRHCILSIVNSVHVGR